jgi:ERF superfamily
MLRQVPKMLDKMQSDQINELVIALSKVQGELTPAIKDSKNPFFKSTYADLSSVWGCCKDSLSKNGLAIIQTMDFKDGQNFLMTTLGHASGQWMRSCTPLINEKGNVQGLGSAITYMRRYALSAIVGIICDEDDDGNASCPPKTHKSADEKITPKQAELLDSMLAQCDDVYVAKVEGFYRDKFDIEIWTDLPKNQFQGLYDKLMLKLKEKIA